LKVILKYEDVKEANESKVAQFSIQEEAQDYLEEEEM